VRSSSLGNGFYCRVHRDRPSRRQASARLQLGDAHGATPSSDRLFHRPWRWGASSADGGVTIFHLACCSSCADEASTIAPHTFSLADMGSCADYAGARAFFVTPRSPASGCRVWSNSGASSLSYVRALALIAPLMTAVAVCRVSSCRHLRPARRRPATVFVRSAPTDGLEGRVTAAHSARRSQLERNPFRSLILLAALVCSSLCRRRFRRLANLHARGRFRLDAPLLAGANNSRRSPP